MKKIYTLANMAKGMMLAALLAVGTDRKSVGRERVC